MAEIIKRKKINSSVEQSPQGSRFVSRAAWTKADYDQEWQFWIDDVCKMLADSGRTARSETFTPESWRVLNIIHGTARAARQAGDMASLRLALQRYREAARHFLGIPETKPAAGEARRSA